MPCNYLHYLPGSMLDNYAIISSPILGHPVTVTESPSCKLCYNSEDIGTSMLPSPTPPHNHVLPPIS